jgi:hypothetical protein
VKPLRLKEKEMGLLHRHGHHEEVAAPAKRSLAPMPGATDEYQQKIRAQMEQELTQQRASMSDHSS